MLFTSWWTWEVFKWAKTSSDKRYLLWVSLLCWRAAFLSLCRGRGWQAHLKRAVISTPLKMLPPVHQRQIIPPARVVTWAMSNGREFFPILKLFLGFLWVSGHESSSQLIPVCSWFCRVFLSLPPWRSRTSHSPLSRMWRLNFFRSELVLCLPFGVQPVTTATILL